MTYCKKNYELKEWRKSSFWRSSLKSLTRSCGKACASTSKNKQTAIRSKVEEYLRLSKELDEKVTKSAARLKVSPLIDWSLLCILDELDYYQKMLKKHIDLVDRRLLRGEQIPTEEKIYSIFEPTKAKPNIDHRKNTK